MYTYETLKALPLNTKFTVFDGVLRQDDNGEFRTSSVVDENVVYLNPIEKSFVIIPSDDNLLGQPYKVRRSDCVILGCKYLDKIYNSNLHETLMALPIREYIEGYTYGYQVEKLVDWGFTPIDEPEENCIATYEDIEEDNEGATHICVFENDNTILRHHRGELSTRDDVVFLDYYYNVRYYRYGN